MTRRRVLILAGVPVAPGDAYSYVSTRGRTPTRITVDNGRLALMDASATIKVRAAEFDLANCGFEHGRGRVVRDAISRERVEQLTAEEH